MVDGNVRNAGPLLFLSKATWSECFVDKIRNRPDESD